MSYHIYNDPVKFFLDICQPDWVNMTEENKSLFYADISKIGEEMIDKKFERNYVSSAKKVYLSYLKKKDEAGYVPPSVMELDHQIRLCMDETQHEKTHTEALISPHILDNRKKSEGIQKEIDSLKAKILSLRQSKNGE